MSEIESLIRQQLYTRRARYKAHQAERSADDIRVGLELYGPEAFSVPAKRSMQRSMPTGHSVKASLALLIVCGNCSGDGRFPYLTELTKLGTCCECGGESWVPAAQQSQAIIHHSRLRNTQDEPRRVYNMIDRLNTASI